MWKFRTLHFLFRAVGSDLHGEFIELDLPTVEADDLGRLRQAVHGAVSTVLEACRSAEDQEVAWDAILRDEDAQAPMWARRNHRNELRIPVRCAGLVTVELCLEW